ncbi:MAG: lipoprotein [Pseudomonadota bacterium]|nr:lipoprotein [Pseudomonadota bacterium]
MVPIRRTAALLLMLGGMLMVQGCGQKGALYREAPVEDVPVAKGTSEAAGDQSETNKSNR